MFNRICSLGAVLLIVGVLVRSPLLAEEFRKFSDSSGEFEIEATFVSQKDGAVTLKTKDGELIEIELAKPSEADRTYLGGLKENPFKPKPANPFKPKSANEQAERTVGVDWSGSKEVLLHTDSEEWKTEVSSFELGYTPKTVLLPGKTDFFEKMSKLAVNSNAGRAVVGYSLKRGRDGSSRMLVCNLKSGEIDGSVEMPDLLAPLAIDDDGKRILMRRNEFGFGNLDRLELWTRSGETFRRSLVWTPHDDQRGAARDVMWAAFVDANRLATSSRGGRVAIWNAESAEPICHFDLCDGAVPALSPDRKTIGFSSDKEVGLFDIETQTMIAVTATPRSLQWPYVAFSPSGKRLGCIAFNQMLVWDVATGTLESEVPCTGINVHGEIAFPHESYLLGGKRFLVDVDNQIKLWQYDGIEEMATAGEWTLAGVSDRDRSGALLALKLPQPEAIGLLEQALTEPDLFVFRAGTSVTLNVDAIAADKQADVRNALTAKLKSMGCPVEADGSIELVATVTGPQVREVAYHHSGEFKVKEYIARLTFVYEGKDVWQTSRSSVPGVISIKRGENIATALRKTEKPHYGLFENVEIPKFLQKPSEGKGANSRQTLGQSRFTPRGL